MTILYFFYTKDKKQPIISIYSAIIFLIIAKYKQDAHYSKIMGT